MGAELDRATKRFDRLVEYRNLEKPKSAKKTGNHLISYSTAPACDLYKFFPLRLSGLRTETLPAWAELDRKMIRNGLSRISLPAIISSSSTAVSSLLDSTFPSYRTPTRFESASVADALDVDRQPPSKVAAEPILLQPRVVIYDGVCHLCHRGE